MRASILTITFTLNLSLLMLSGCDQSVATPESSSVARQAADNSDAQADVQADAAIDVHDSETLPPAGDAINVENDPVDVKVGGGEGVQVDAPGVDLKIGGGNGIDVDIDEPSH